MTLSAADNEFERQAQALGFDFNGEIKIGGHYASSVIQHGHEVYMSGQIPRVDDKVVVTGAAGEVVTLEQAQRAAQICVMRALTLLRNQLGSLSKLNKFCASRYM